MNNQNKNPFFSIVMPTYGVEKYITEAIRSIQKQTYSEWEIIVVDDCTPDKSAEIAQRFAKQDERIKIVHHDVNKGLSSARNTGTQVASGQYIWYMDPDDYVDTDVLMRVKESLDKNLAEVVLFGHVEEYYDQDGKLDYTHTVCPKEKLYDNQKTLRKEVIDLEQQTLYGYAWNKIYNLAYLKKHGFQFETVKLIEDIVFNVQFFMDIERLNILGFTPYHYGKRMSENLTNKFVPEYFPLHKRRIEILFEQHRKWNLCTQEVRQILGSLYGRYILSALERNCDKRAKMTHAERKQWCKELFSQELFQELIPDARAKDSKSLAIALKFLKWKSSTLCLVMGRGVHIIKGGVPMLYSKVKSER